jgi:hypothetical protein
LDFVAGVPSHFSIHSIVFKGYHSTFGVGKSCPDPNEFTKLDNDVLVPFGPCQAAAGVKKSDLLYNEFIVYDVAQLKLRFLVEVEFEFIE